MNDKDDTKGNPPNNTTTVLTALETSPSEGHVKTNDKCYKNMDGHTLEKLLQEKVKTPVNEKDLMNTVVTSLSTIPSNSHEYSILE